ncbi:hypothetical protein P350_21825 [Burkholderia cepacia JBK9]|nr:hypothetical protein P350_21825 [Burkholderia cepacia JBK9]
MRFVAFGAAAATAAMSVVPAAFAQASAAVTSSVFVHQPYDTGNSAIDDNFRYISHPPIRPVAASEPTVAHGAHRGRRGQAGSTNAAGASGGGASNNTAAMPLPQMPTAEASNASVSQ